jgi:integrase-like protein
MLARYVKDSTAKTYSLIWKKYVRFCQEKGRFMERGKTLVEFIAHLDEEGFAASTIRTYAVAISSVAIEDPLTGEKIGQDPDVERILSAVKRHGMRYLKDNAMWDLGEALSRLKEVDDTDLAKLTSKTAFLLAIVTFWRPGSDLARISHSSIKFDRSGKEVTLYAIDVKEAYQKHVRIVAFEDEGCCPVVTLKKYLHATKDMEARKLSDALFLTRDGRDPLKAERISKLLKIFMEIIGINEKFTPHSTRATAPSSMLLESMPIPWIMARANWGSATTFAKHYRKDFVDRDCAVTNTIQSKLLPQLLVQH